MQRMKSFVPSTKVSAVLGPLIASVWLFHGIYSKIFDGIPRHRLIVGRIIGEGIAGRATIVIGALEVLLGIWVFSGWRRRACAFAQTAAIVCMNALEISLARDLLISATGMVALNVAFLALVWYWALSARIDPV